MRYTGIKGKAWEAVKRSVRRRYKHCYTCSARNLETYNAQSGHYKPVALVGSNNYWSWHPDFIRLQCGRCNGAGAGMSKEYEAHLIRDIGKERVAEFEREYRRVRPIKNWKAVIDQFDAL